MTSVYPSEVFPFVRSFLVANGYSATVAAFDKELGKNKVVIETTEDLLLEACKDFITAHREKKSKQEKRKAEDAPDHKAKKVKVDKKEKEEESSDSDSNSDSSSGSGSGSGSSDSDSDSSKSSGSDSDSSDSDSDSDSEESSSGSDSDSSSGSGSDSDSSEEEKAKKAKKDKKKDKKDKKSEEKEKDAKENGKTSTPATPTTPATNGHHTPAVTPGSSAKKNAPFRRVTEDDEALLKTKFSDNTFESKGGDGYGKQANDILSKVKGKGFRTAKTKKKKGTYRGGPIDIRVNSVKFEHDD